MTRRTDADQAVLADRGGASGGRRWSDVTNRLFDPLTRAVRARHTGTLEGARASARDIVQSVLLDGVRRGSPPNLPDGRLFAVLLHRCGQRVIGLRRAVTRLKRRWDRRAGGDSVLAGVRAGGRSPSSEFAAREQCVLATTTVHAMAERGELTQLDRLIWDEMLAGVKADTIAEDAGVNRRTVNRRYLEIFEKLNTKLAPRG